MWDISRFLGFLFQHHNQKLTTLDFFDFVYTIMLSDSSQGESSVLRVRLRVVKNPLRICTSPLWICISRSEYTLAEVEYTSLPPSVYCNGLVCIRNGLMHIRNGVFMTLKSDSHYWTLTLRTAAEENSPLLSMRREIECMFLQKDLLKSIGKLLFNAIVLLLTFCTVYFWIRFQEVLGRTTCNQ